MRLRCFKLRRCGLKNPTLTKRQGGLLFIFTVDKSRRSLGYHQHKVLHLIKPQEIQPSADDIRLWRWYARKSVMICQACGLNKKISLRRTRFFGRSDKTWTCDPQTPSLVRYHLRYTPKWDFVFQKNYYVLHNKKVVEVTGLEPAASASRTQRSTKLSHTSIQLLFRTSNIIAQKISVV